MRRFLSGLMNGALALSLIGFVMIIANRPAQYIDLGPGYFDPFPHALAAQGSLCMPTTGTVSGLQMSQNINTAHAALVSSNSGNSPPSNDCTAAPVKGQWWLDTSLTPNQAKMYDGTQWLTVAAMDATGHAWLPRVGDGTITLPGMAFQAEINTGFRRAASGDLRITIGGVDIVQITSGGLNMLAGTTNTVPVGTVVDYCGPTEPTGWIFGGGQAESRTGTTAALFAVYGTTFGIGNGTTTFNVPDLRGRVIAARDNMGSLGAASRLTSTHFGVAATTLGAVGNSSESHTLSQIHLPNVTFPVSGSISPNTGGVFSPQVVVNGSPQQAVTGFVTGTSIAVYPSSSFSTLLNNVFSLNAASGGSATPIRTIQPTILCNKIIKL